MKNIYILYILTLMLLFGACKDALDKYPLDKPSSESFFTNEFEIGRGINACYWFLQESSDFQNVYPLALDLMSDNGYCRQGAPLQAFARGEQDFQNVLVAEIWARSFQGVGRCNNILKNIEIYKGNLTIEKYKQFRGEALFLRGYYYARLINYYGDVPLVLEPINSSEEAKAITRVPKEKVLEQILKDFDDAASLLPLQYEKKEDIGRATKGTALSYKARTALYQGLWDVAAESAKLVIESKIYSLYPKYGNLFVSTGLQDAANKEIILKREYSEITNDFHLLTRMMQTRNNGGNAVFVPSQNLVDSYDCIDGQNTATSQVFSKSAPFENRDPRLKLSILTAGERFGDFQFENHYDSLTCYNYVTKQRVLNQDCYQNNAFTSFTGYNSKKYNDFKFLNNQDKGSYPIILCRFAEVLLIYAEAKAELNQIDQSVVDALNLIRNGRDDVKMPAFNIADLGSPVAGKRIIRHERKIELALEGFRFMDLIRWGQAEKYRNQPLLGRPFKGSFSSWPSVVFDENGEPQYPGYQQYIPHPSTDYRIVDVRKFNLRRDKLFPIPQKELNLNPGLGQNDGY